MLGKVKNDEEFANVASVKKASSSSNLTSKLLYLFGGLLVIASFFLTIFYDSNWFLYIFIGLLTVGVAEIIDLLEKLVKREK